MIHIQTLRVHEFRGIRDLSLDLDNENFAICGSNGTGKSGVVDALEFVLSGTISRLSGRGRGELSIKIHGPHVDCALPENAFVEAVLRVPSLNKTMAIRRTVKAPNVPEIAPDTAEMRKVLAYLEDHPEFALSRREITNYVLAEPSQRSKATQELLKLDRINALRLRFQKIARDSFAMAKSATQTQLRAEEGFSRALNASAREPAAILAVVNAQRSALGLTIFQAIDADTSISAGVVDAGKQAPTPANKAVAASDLRALREAQAVRKGDNFEAIRVDVVQQLDRLQADAALLNAVIRDNFLKSALDLFDGEHCPACDADYTLDHFVDLINRKRIKLVEVRERRSSAEERLAPLIARLEKERDLLRTVWVQAVALLEKQELEAVKDWGVALGTAIAQLKAFLPLDATLAALSSLPDPNTIAAIMDRFEILIGQLPEPSVQNAAAAMLSIAQERLNTLRDANRQKMRADRQAVAAQRVNAIYVAETEAALEAIYEKVQARFSHLYRQINAEDESAFEAEIKQDKAGLDFKVDFYNRGKFPPAAYHSEGHQDSMGLCLYLALMDYLQGDKFTFAVLDDVLMSVDTGHRREVTRMLRAEFPNTQFALTTHDFVWQKFMQTTGLVSSKNIVRFRKWSVESGPCIWRDNDVWIDIETLNRNGNILEAATQLRNYLEYVASEACQALRAKVIYNADGRYDLGDLLDSAFHRLRELYSDALKAAATWENPTKTAIITERKTKLERAIKEANIERWQINPAIHFNEWCNLHSLEFGAVAAAYKHAVAQLHCPTCSGLLEIVPPRGAKEHILCGCGDSLLSFAHKPKTIVRQ